MKGANLIVKNTLMLYSRQIFIMLVNLYAVRAVLVVLGPDDYGLYNVVAGTATMFSFLSSAMASASQRYFSFDLGKYDAVHLRTTFSVVLQIYIVLAVAAIVLYETVGLWFVNNKLVIPTGRIRAVNWAFQATIISFLMMLLATPYMAVIIARENMKVYAYISIMESFLKLCIVFSLHAFSCDKLIVYSILIAMPSLVSMLLYGLYCHRNYEECKICFIKNLSLFKEMVSYSGWNLFGSASSVACNQGVTILLNLFFGPSVNASRAIAVQVNAAILSFAQNFSTALRPRIIKSYAGGNEGGMLLMVMYGTKTVFFLMLMICIPLCFQTPYLLGLWLKDVPCFTEVFVRLVIIDVLIDSISYPLMAVSQAVGKIKLYQSAVGGCRLLNLPVSYVLLRQGFPAKTVFVVSIMLSILALLLRIAITQKIIAYNLAFPLLKLFLLFFVLASASVVLPVVVVDKMNDALWKVVLFLLISTLWTSAIIFSFGLNKEEKKVLMDKLARRNRWTRGTDF